MEDLHKEFKSSRDHTRNLEALREQDREQMRRGAEQIERLGSQLAEVQSACQGAMAQLEQKRDDSVRQRQQLADTEGAYQVATAQLEQKRDEVMHLRQRLTDIQSAYQVATAQLEQSKEEIASQRQQLAHVQSTHQGAAAQLEQSREEMEEILARLREIEKRDAEFQTIWADLGSGLNSKVERLSVRLGSLESSVDNVARQTHDILYSRIWRTLCTAGAWLLGFTSIFHGRRPSRQPAPVESASRAPKDDSPAARESTESFDLVYDEPQAGIETARTGKIAVRGWALADTGVERIEVRLGTARAVTETGLIRVDVARSHPHAAGARTCGYATEIDSTGLPGGRHALHITGVSRGGSVREVQTLVYNDHETGFASDYDRWMAEFETRNPSLIQLKMRTFTLNPLISVAMPVYRTPLPVLTRAIESVLAQSYSRWELCIADDGSCSAEIESCLKQYAQRESRIKLRLLQANGGIAHASNAALELATGDFVALLDHDDELAEDALYWVVEALNRQPDLDILYSDEDKIDEQGKRYDPFFKPDWSPDLLLSENYVAHLLVCRRSLLVDVGGFRTSFDGSQDYDLVLRLTGKSGKIGHIAGVLYHWRALATSTASRSTQKSYAADAARRAIEEHLTRCSIAAKVVPGIIDGRWRVRYRLAPEPMVSIIIASGGKTEILRVNLESIFGKTSYQNYEVVVIDNSKGEDIKKLVTQWPGRPLRYIDWRGQPFNYSTINNEAARQSNSPLLLFLNDDTSVIDAGWLTALVEIAARPEVGAAGAKLLYPDGRIQHAGVVMGIFDNCGHAFKGLPGDMQHYFDFPDVIRNVSAVTGACLMTRAEVFHEAGGFDEQNFAVAFNDIDLCLKIREKGYRVIYTPHAVLYHHEAFSKTARDLMPDPAEVQMMRNKWKQVIDADPYYSPNLTRTAEDYSLGRKPGLTTPR
jgi:O-antigen biosynthesis protein